MGGGGGTQESKTTTELSPDFKPYVQYALGQAKSIYEQPSGIPEQLYVDPSQATQAALQMAQERATAGSPLISQAQQSLSNIIGSTSPYGQQIANLGMGARDPSAEFYSSMMQGAPESEAMRMARATASGQYLQPNEFLSGALSQANRLTGEQYNRNIQALQSQASSAGRYGSAAMGQQAGQAQDVLARALSEQNQQAYLQNYAQERAAQEAAIGRLGGFEQQGVANRFAGAQGLTAGQQQALQTQLASLGSAAGIRQQDIGAQFAAAQAAPQMAAADYADIQRLLQVGQGREAYDQARIQGQLAAADVPFNRLQRATNIFYGAPLETTTEQTATPQGGK
jgi:hypothetical protein